MNCKMYKKRAGTSGIRGHFYETKLIALINFRLKHDECIKSFHLATNVDNIGIFDDICFRAKVNGFKQPLAVYIQTKHREGDKVLTFNIKKDFRKLFSSYMDIRRAFKQQNKSILFEGNFDDTECLFVMYTTAQANFNKTSSGSSFASKLNYLIGTNDTGCYTQPTYHDKDINFLCKVVLEEQITTLAKNMAKMFSNENDHIMSMNDDLMLQYHVILAQKVLNVSEIKEVPERHRIAHFRKDFFDNNEESLLLYKDTLFIEILKKRKLGKTKIKELLAKFFHRPFQIEILSTLIGSAIVYNNGKFTFVTKMSEDSKLLLDKVNVPQSTVDEAIKMAAKEILTSRQFKVPAQFGNKDLTLRGDDEKIEMRLNHLTSKFIPLFHAKPDKIITIDESLGDGFLKLNGGLAGTVGNLLVRDKNTQLLKFVDNCEVLEDRAKRLFIKLQSNVQNFQEYSFDVKMKKFPKLSFDIGEYDKNMVNAFLSNFIFYTNQADEYGVEEILKSEIRDHLRGTEQTFQVKTSARFLKYHNEIQKWWMNSEGYYLTKESEIYENATKNIVKEPLMTVINSMHMIKIKNLDYTFKENVINSLKLYEQRPVAHIMTDNILLTLSKVKQYFQNKDHVVLDLEYILYLQDNDYKALCTEVTTTNKTKILIIVCSNIPHTANWTKRLETIATIVDGKQIIIITKRVLRGIINTYFSQADYAVNDTENNLIDMSEDSERNLVFHRQEVSLDVAIKETSMSFCKSTHNEAALIGEANRFDCYKRMCMIYYDPLLETYSGRNAGLANVLRVNVSAGMRVHTQSKTFIRLQPLFNIVCARHTRVEEPEIFSNIEDDQEIPNTEMLPGTDVLHTRNEIGIEATGEILGNTAVSDYRYSYLYNLLCRFNHAETVSESSVPSRRITLGELRACAKLNNFQISVELKFMYSVASWSRPSLNGHRQFTERECRFGFGLHI